MILWLSVNRAIYHESLLKYLIGKQTARIVTKLERFDEPMPHSDRNSILEGSLRPYLRKNNFLLSLGPIHQGPISMGLSFSRPRVSLLCFQGTGTLQLHITFLVGHLMHFKACVVVG